MHHIRKILIVIQPLQVLLALMSYGLGLGLARYLGANLNSEPQFLGGVIVAVVLITANLLKEYFQVQAYFDIPSETRRENEILRPLILVLSISLILLVAILLFMLTRDGFMNLEVTIIMSVFVILSLLLALPPVQLNRYGLGELATAVQIASLAPSIAFFFTFGKFHRLLTLYSIPLFFLGLAYLLALNFPTYAQDLKFKRRSLLINLTWQRAVPIHNSLIVGAYLFFAAIPSFGIPFSLIWPALLTLPIAGYQVINLRNISEGSKPNWPIFIAIATMIFGLTTYLLALTLWLN